MLEDPKTLIITGVFYTVAVVIAGVFIIAICGFIYKLLTGKLTMSDVIDMLVSLWPLR